MYRSNSLLWLARRANRRIARWVQDVCSFQCAFPDFVLLINQELSGAWSHVVRPFQLVGTRLASSSLPTSSLGWMWLHDNLAKRHTNKTLYFRSLILLNVFLVVSGIFIMITGTWAAAVSIKDSYATGNISSPFSCADNSGST